MSKLSNLRTTVAVMAGVAGVMAATSGSAAIYEYTLANHPDGALSAFDYGLRLDGENRVFSFSQGAAATLTYNDTANTATISGTMVESLGSGSFGGTWNISYSMDTLAAGGGSAGSFVDGTGNGMGTISMGGTSYNLGSAANNAGEYFIFADDDYRLGGHGLPSNTFVGRGWVGKDQGPRGRANDFLFTATGGLTVPGPTPVPLPAAGLLMIAGLGGLGAMRRRRKQA